MAPQPAGRELDVEVVAVSNQDRITDDDILSLWRTVRPGPAQNAAMVYQDGPYDIEHPTHELRRLVELAIERGQGKG